MFFIAYAFKGQMHVFAGRVKIVGHSSCRTSAILKYFCTLQRQEMNITCFCTQLNVNSIFEKSVVLRNEFNFCKVHGIMNTLGLLESKGFMLILQETRSIHDSMNLPKIEFTRMFFYEKKDVSPLLMSKA